MLHASTERCSDLWSIRDMTKAFGVTMRALRFYEARGLLRPERAEPKTGSARNTPRLYDTAQRRRLELILKAKSLGFTLTQTEELLAGGPDETALELALDPSRARVQMDCLRRQRDDLDRAIRDLEAVAAMAGNVPPPGASAAA